MRPSDKDILKGNTALYTLMLSRYFALAYDRDPGRCIQATAKRIKKDVDSYKMMKSLVKRLSTCHPESANLSMIRTEKNMREQGLL